VLDQAYASLGPMQQKLLSRIACFRRPVNYDALRALAKTKSAGLRVGALGRRKGVQISSEAALDCDLRDLIGRGLLHHDFGTNRFDLHPIVRRYAYDSLAELDRVGAHTRLRDYFAAVPEPEKMRNLDDLAPVIELYHHTVHAGQYDAALTLFRDRIEVTANYQLGAYQLQIDLLRALFPEGEDKPPRLKDKRDQGWAINQLAYSYSQAGQPRRAAPLFEWQIAIFEEQLDREEQINKADFAITLGNLAYLVQLHIGALTAAETNLFRRRSSLYANRRAQCRFDPRHCRQRYRRQRYRPRRL